MSDEAHHEDPPTQVEGEYIDLSHFSEVDLDSKIIDDLRQLDQIAFERKYRIEPGSGREWYVHSQDSFDVPTLSDATLDALKKGVNRATPADWALAESIVLAGTDDSSVARLHRVADSIAALIDARRAT